MAYTKYSLTPANNTATPPDGAPEGMLPSAVNDTMRDMMAQIRDCGDGIRDGTYTMTAAKITGGTITGTTVTSNTFSSSGATITGGTINGTAIGGTTAAAGKFTTLEATGVTTVQAGTVSAPAITTSGDTNTGIFFPAADTIAFAEGGAEAMRIDSSGNVGIGVTPSAWSTTVPALQLGGGGAFLAALGSSPYVALGTNAHYNGTNFVYRTTNTASYYDQSSGLHRWYTAPSGTAGTNVTFTQAMTLDASGNVGVGNTPSGTSATGYRSLELGTTAGTGITAGNGDFYVPVNAYVAGGAWKYATTSTASLLNINTTTLTWSNAGSGTAGNNISFSERMRIDSSGNLLVGASTVGLENGGIQFQPNGNITSVPFIGCSGNSSSGSYISYGLYSTSLSQYQFYVGYNGTIAARSTSITGLSDISEKENIQPLETGLNEVLALQPRRFDWKNGSGQNIAGFVAQEVETVLPDLVEEYKVDETTTKKGLKMGDMIPTLVKAIQEQQAMIEELKAKVTALENK